MDPSGQLREGGPDTWTPPAASYAAARALVSCGYPSSDGSDWIMK